MKHSYPSHDCHKGTLSPPPTEPTCEKLLDVDFIFSPLPRQMTCEISVKNAYCIFFLVFSLYLFINWCPTLKARDLWFVYLYYWLGIYLHSTCWNMQNLKLLLYLHVYSRCSLQMMEQHCRVFACAWEGLSSTALPSVYGIGKTPFFL